MKALIITATTCAMLTFSAATKANFLDWISNLFSGPSVDYGAWQCVGCQLQAPGQDHNTQALGEVAEFIRINNEAIHSSKNELVDRWKPNSRITICDGSRCMDFWFDPLPAARWAPRYPSRLQLPSDNPRVPPNPNPQTSAPVPAVLISITVFGPTYYEMVATMPGDLVAGTGVLGPIYPTVTVDYPPGQVRFRGPPMHMPPELGFIIGGSLNWSPAWTSGLSPGGGGNGCDPTTNVCTAAN